MNKEESPCIRNCCLDPQDICVGCYRHIDEIVAWSSSNEQQRITILARCAERKKASQQEIVS